MKIVSIIDLSKKIKKYTSNNPKVIFIRINPYPLNDMLKLIYGEISNKLWINKYKKDIIRKSIEERANKTIEKINEKLKLCKNDIISSEVGEYIISILGKQALSDSLNYIHLPLAELWKEKASGNPGFDFHSESTNNKIIFGEAKYVCGKNAYNSSLSQINKFIVLKKDLMEIVDLEVLVSNKSVTNFENNRKGYAAAFSSTSVPDTKLIKNICENSSFRNLLIYDELLLVAVDINE